MTLARVDYFPPARTGVYRPDDFRFASPARLNTMIRGPVLAGKLIILLFAAVLCIWGFAIPLDGGASAPGIVSPDSGRKTIQNLEGGILSELAVHDGDTVTAGQKLVVIGDVRELANHDALQEQRWSLIARQARLDAERADASSVAWPRELLAPVPQIQAVLKAQQQVFETRRLAYTTKKDVLGQRIHQLQEQMKGYAAQVLSANQQLTYITEETAGKRILLQKGLVPKPEYLRLKRSEAEIIGQRGSYQAQIAQANQQIGEAKMQILAAEAERSDQVSNEADKVRSDLTDVEQKLRASDDVLKRAVVTSPVSGTVINMKFKTIGGVVQRGESILEIVPSEKMLVIEARVTPLDVRAVHKGLDVKVHLSAYTGRTIPRVPGVVESVSADRVVDPNTHDAYYLVRIAVDRDQIHQLAPTVHLIPGMPTEVLIVTEHRTMFEYLLKPFTEIFRKSFHEI